MVKIAEFAGSYLKDFPVHALGFDRMAPTFLNFSVSNRCNAMCAMCDIWRYPSQDATGDDLDRMFAHPHMQEITDFGLTGGEPFIRRDLPDVMRAAMRHLPRLKQIAITSNGFNTHRIESVLTEILPEMKARGVLLILTISVDGVGEVHNAVRGIPGVWRKVDKSLMMLKRMSKDHAFHFGMACTISKRNASSDALKALADYTAEHQIPITYRLAVKVSRIYNDKLIEAEGVEPHTPEAGEILRFLESMDQKKLSWREEYYRYIIALLKGKEETVGRPLCKEQRDGGMMDSNGDLYVCSVSGIKVGNVLDGPIERSAMMEARKLVRKDFCDHCHHDHAIYPKIGTVLRAARKMVAGKL